MPILSLFSLPDATSTISSIGSYSSPMFTELLPLVGIILGFAIGGIIVSLVVRSVMKGVREVVGRRRGGRRRR